MRVGVSGNQIRAEVDFLREELRRTDLKEKWLKDSDPSISVLDFLEEVSQSIGAVKRAYAAGAGNRNTIKATVAKEVADIQGACQRLLSSFEASASDPEDTNTTLA